MHELALARSTVLPVDGTTYDAIAEIPKATHPSRLTAAIHHSSVRPRAADEAAADLEIGEIPRDKEADRTERVRRPYQLVVLRRVEARLERVESADVEEERPRDLDDAAPPVDPARLEGEQAHPALAGAARASIGIDRLEVLERRGRREEDRADEEDRCVYGRPYKLDEAREGTQEEAGGSDREQDADPPGRTPRRPQNTRVLPLSP